MKEKGVQRIWVETLLETSFHLEAHSLSCTFLLSHGHGDMHFSLRVNDKWHADSQHKVMDLTLSGDSRSDLQKLSQDGGMCPLSYNIQTKYWPMSFEFHQRCMMQYQCYCDRVNIKFDIDTIGHVQLDAPIYFREEAI